MSSSRAVRDSQISISSSRWRRGRGILVIKGKIGEVEVIRISLTSDKTFEASASKKQSSIAAWG
ncbi:hypothetical protein BJX63DRAFT_416103 [Aspergillus granulosus]|uniref:Uncharacterized protein n=1 Tax=Aspergillus granulosus TaxID=176169 RepID=A0ABR4GSE7_9EURO